MNPPLSTSDSISGLAARQNLQQAAKRVLRQSDATVPAIAAPLYHLQLAVWEQWLIFRWSLNLKLPHRGPHALRHAGAGHLLAEGLFLKEIGDHLGPVIRARRACTPKVDPLTRNCRT